MIPIFFGLLLLMTTTIAGAKCPDLSGRYVLPGQDGQVYITIKQSRCERVTIEWLISVYDGTSRTTHVLPLDGRFHPDTGWFGEREKGLTSAQFRSNALEIVSKSKEKKGALNWEQSFTLLQNKDLCTRFLYYHDGSLSTRRAGRQRTNDLTGEDEAARRAEGEC
jgi:hypothetical protein